MASGIKCSLYSIKFSAFKTTIVTSLRVGFWLKFGKRDYRSACGEVKVLIYSHNIYSNAEQVFSYNFCTLFTHGGR